jgi:tripartite-type tricarboxylate transporter receptor subunit TctC
MGVVWGWLAAGRMERARRPGRAVAAVLAATALAGDEVGALVERAAPLAFVVAAVVGGDLDVLWRGRLVARPR